jgi:anti-sigma-K factor RskA
MKLPEHWFERALWRSRYVVVLAVVASMCCAFAILYVATTDVVLPVGHVLHYADPQMAVEARTQVVDAESRLRVRNAKAGVKPGHPLPPLLLVGTQGEPREAW